MFKDNNINEFDLMMKSILDEGREEVPAGVWKGVSEGLDKIDASGRKPAVVIWFRRAGYAAAAAVAAIAAFIILNHTGNEEILPDDGGKGLIAVVEPDNAITDIEENESVIEGKTVSTVLMAEAKENTTTHQTASQIPATAQELIESLDATEKMDEPARNEEKMEERKETEQVYFPDDWGEEEERFRPETAIVLSGLAGTNSTQAQSRTVPQKAPVVTPAPDRTGITETSTRSTYGIPVSIGAGIKIGLSPRWSLGIGANYTMLTRTFYGKYIQVNPDGTIENTTSSDIRNIQHYAGIPVNAYYDIIRQDRVSLYTYGGGSIEKCLSDTYDVLSTSISHKEKAKGLQFSVNVGIGVEFALGKHLGIYIDPSLRYYFDNDQPKSIRTTQPLMFGFETGLRVNL